MMRRYRLVPVEKTKNFEISHNFVQQDSQGRMQEWIGMRGGGLANSDPEEGMSGQSRPYAIHSDSECDRLERQAMLAGLEQHLTVLTELPRLTSILDVGCGSGSMARLLAAK
jgi:2-polyprenyl-3-methyl-5-hydroxy-6-metoxy-1,4-benzoquinol methylase